jgi:hypothetical protein
LAIYAYVQFINAALPPYSQLILDSAQSPIKNQNVYRSHPGEGCCETINFSFGNAGGAPLGAITGTDLTTYSSDTISGAGGGTNTTTGNGRKGGAGAAHSFEQECIL